MPVDNTIAIAIITGVIQVGKLAGLPSKFAAIAALGLGLVLGLVFDFSVQGALNGVVYGLSSSGLYSVIRYTADATKPPAE